MIIPARRIVLVPFLSSIFLVSCKNWTQRGAKGVGLLTQPPPAAIKLSSYEPQNPYSELTPGLWTRTLFQTAVGGGYRIEIRDLAVSPGKKVTKILLPGAAIFDVRSGTGTLTSGGKRQEIRFGSTFSIDDGTDFDLENTSALVLAMRVDVFLAAVRRTR